MGIRRILSRLTVLVLLLLVGFPAHAVDLNATLKGVVADTDGLPVPNAEVRIESPELITAQNTLTDDEGRYRFAALPPGEYVVKVKHPGFAPWESGVLKVALGATISIDITLAPAGSGETITVVGSAPAVDVENVQTGAVLDAEFLKNIPNGRDYHGAISMAPGVVGSGNPNTHGAFDSSNQFYIDGVNTTDPLTNTFSMNMNYDAIESIEVITGGMDAEYGRSLGGAFNIVTKSGGNEFEGNVFLQYGDERFIAAPALEGDQRADQVAGQAVLNLGGPILRDKIWFFASAQTDRQAQATPVDPEVGRDLDRFPMQPYDYRSVYLFGKITAQPLPQHRLWFHAQGDPTMIYNVNQDPYGLPSTELIQKQGGWLASLGHTFTPNDDLLVETQIFYEKSIIDVYPVLWKDCENFDEQGVCTDDFVGTDYLGEPVTQSWTGYGADDFSSGQFPYASFNQRYRASVQSSATYWFDAFGEHEAKIGLQGEIMTSYYVYPGLIVDYYTHTADPMDLASYEPAQRVVYRTDWETDLTGQIVSWYAQDVWQPIPSVTIRPGLRFDAPMLKNDVKDTVLSGVTVAPRIGVAYDVGGRGRTAVHAFYGRFYDSGFLGVSDLMNSNPQGYAGYSWDAETGDWATEPDYVVSGRNLVHSDIKNPYSDEIDVGVAQQLGEDWAIDVVGVYEKAQNFWEDDEVNLIWNDEGTDVIGYRNGVNETLYRIRTPDDVWTKYTSLELVLTKRFSDNFGVLASYTWSRSTGTNSADQATGVLDVPQQKEFETGILDYDIPHYLKASGSYTKPDVASVGRMDVGYTLGWNSWARSGYSYRPLAWNDYYSDYTNYVTPADGRYRLPMFAQTDLRAVIELSLASEDDEPAASWQLGVECFNVFNDRTPTNVNVEYDPEATTADQVFGQVTDRQSPRTFQILARGEF
jgi:hypothetical protein